MQENEYLDKGEYDEKQKICIYCFFYYYVM